MTAVSAPLPAARASRTLQHPPETTNSRTMQRAISARHDHLYGNSRRGFHAAYPYAREEILMGSMAKGRITHGTSLAMSRHRSCQLIGCNN